MSELQAQAYANDFFDVRSLNEHISAKLEARVDDVQRAAMQGAVSPSRAIVVLGAAGGGKTHLFARLRRHCGPHATLVLLRPYFGAALTPRNVLAACVDHICAGPAGDTDIAASQLALVAAYWLADEQARAYPAMVLDDIAHDGAPERAARIERGIARVLTKLPRSMAAAHIVRALLTVAGANPPPYETLAWLAGRDQGGDRPPLSESDVMQTLQILAVLAAPVAPFVVVLDQLENLASSDGARVVAYGSVISELVDVVPNLTIVQLALTSEWRQYIEPNLSLPHRTRVATSVNQLETPSREQRLALLQAWHEQAFDGAVEPTFPAPLTATQLEELLDAPGMTPRLLLAALQQAYALPGRLDSAAGAATILATTPTPTTPVAPSLSAWERETERAASKLRRLVRAQQPVDAIEVAEGLAAGLSYIPNATVEVLTERATLQVVFSAAHTVRFVIMNGLHHSSATAALAKATELAAVDKVVLVREERCPLPASWEAIAERRTAFERLPNARWLWISDDEMRKLLALASAHSLIRAKRWEPGNEVPQDEAGVRAALARAIEPTAWATLAQAARYLADVPHAPVPASRGRKGKKAEPVVTAERVTVAVRATSSNDELAGRAELVPPQIPVTAPTTVAITSVVASASADVPANVSPLPPTHVSSGPTAPADLKQWLDSGKQLARDTFAAYREKLANLRRRK